MAGSPDKSRHLTQHRADHDYHIYFEYNQHADEFRPARFRAGIIGHPTGFANDDRAQFRCGGAVRHASWPGGLFQPSRLRFGTHGSRRSNRGISPDRNAVGRCARRRSSRRLEHGPEHKQWMSQRLSC